MCLAQGPQRSDAGEARTRGPSDSSINGCEDICILNSLEVKSKLMINKYVVHKIVLCFDFLRHNQHFFSHVGTHLPGLNQY